MDSLHIACCGRVQLITCRYMFLGNRHPSDPLPDQLQVTFSMFTAYTHFCCNQPTTHWDYSLARKVHIWQSSLWMLQVSGCIANKQPRKEIQLWSWIPRKSPNRLKDWFRATIQLAPRYLKVIQSVALDTVEAAEIFANVVVEWPDFQLYPLHYSRAQYLGLLRYLYRFNTIYGAGEEHVPP